jgi:hypothetical protein
MSPRRQWVVVLAVWMALLGLDRLDRQPPAAMFATCLARSDVDALRRALALSRRHDLRLNAEQAQVAVLHAVSATAVEVASATIAAAGFSHRLGHFGVVRWQDFLALKGRGFGGGVAAFGGELDVGPGLFVADEAIDGLHIGEIEVFVHPAVTGVAGGASRLVCTQGDAEVVDGQAAFARDAARIGRIGPCPVDRLVELDPGLVVAGEAGAGDLLGFGKWLFEDGVLGVVRGDPGLGILFGGLAGQDAAWCLFVSLRPPGRGGPCQDQNQDEGTKHRYLLALNGTG